MGLIISYHTIYNLLLTQSKLLKSKALILSREPIIMDPWTPEDRNAFFNFAVNTNDNRGYRGPYHFSTLPKANGNEQEDIRRCMVTEALASTVYMKNPRFRDLSLGFYKILFQRLAMNAFTGPYMQSDIFILLKGGNAYAFVTEEKFPDDFKFSDLDIVVYINPYLNDESFKKLEKAVKVTVLQTMSQYKRMLDHMLFLNKPIDGSFLDEQTIMEFKQSYTQALKDVTLPDGAEFVSPFASDDVRNYCSRNSFVITNSKAKQDSVVRIEVPHYDKCERIPLRKTPLFCSYNETIDFQRAGDSALNGHFDLYRIRFNNKYVEKNMETGEVIHEERVPADFIDVSIASKDDAELLDFWNRGRCLCVYDRFAQVWLTVPDIHTCISDLYKMLNIYECPEGKKQKRAQKYNKLREIAAMSMPPYQTPVHMS